MAPNDMERVVDAIEAAEYLRVHRITVIRMARKGVFGRRIGKLWRFKIEDLDRYLSTGQAEDVTSRGADNEQLQAGQS